MTVPLLLSDNKYYLLDSLRKHFQCLNTSQKIFTFKHYRKMSLDNLYFNPF